MKISAISLPAGMDEASMSTGPATATLESRALQQYASMTVDGSASKTSMLHAIRKMDMTNPATITHVQRLDAVHAINLTATSIMTRKVLSAVETLVKN